MIPCIRLLAGLKYWVLREFSLLKKQVITELLNSLEIIYLNPACYELAIALKQQRKMSLGDALIAATCIEHHKTLATRNTADFDWIENMRVINPLL
ncbi:MAG: PIN domain-containing protein [Methylobacter sp.]|nr:PIN domain-containing protein [Methylobacter sp.]MDP2100794.1 PIN domain-containing protein [Methylobacter sp.]MDP2427065.1 PIN domain-containing protein [Methylobacter sp.]MDP3053043.1 PIN domain-containing protein [Methylobacter sp.]MDP3363262.1 PIN domain-containing protein [Methylobacter sp.]